MRSCRMIGVSKITPELRLVVGDDGTPSIEIVDLNKKWKPALKCTSSIFLLISEKETSNTEKSQIDIATQQISYSFADKCVKMNGGITWDKQEQNTDCVTIQINHSGTFRRSLKMEFLSQSWAYLHGPVSFVWTPHVRPAPDYVVGDHIFRSPALIAATSNFGVAFLPDLTIYEDWPLISRTALNFRVSTPTQPLPGGEFAHFWYGYTTYKPHRHVFFRHKRGKRFKVKKGQEFTLSYELLIFTGDSISPCRILAAVNEHLWQKYARPRIHQLGLHPQVLPFEDYVRKIFAVPFDQHKTWVGWATDGHECGGFVLRSWLGKHKKKLKQIPATHTEELIGATVRDEKYMTKALNTRLSFLFNNMWGVKLIDWIGRAIFRQARIIQIWNQAWFMGVRSAYGIFYYGLMLDQPEWVRCGKAMIRALAHAPPPEKKPQGREIDLLPAVAIPSKKGVAWIEGTRAFTLNTFYSLVDVSLGAYWLLKFHRDFEVFCEVLPRVSSVVKSLLVFQEEKGNFPTFVKIQEESIEIDSILENSASCAAILMLLTEYQKVTATEEVIPPAKKLADFLIREILPTNRWHNYELFYSCSHLPYNFFDGYTGSHVQNTLCIYWAAEGLKGLYEATLEKKYLEAGLYVLHVLSLYQQVWDPPFLDMDLFGGFGVQNADAEWSDARQALFVRTYAEYYLLTRDPQWMERSIAALRSCFALAIIPENREISPGQFRGIKNLVRSGAVDHGVVSENYGHLGLDFRFTGYIMFDWGCFSSAFAAAYMRNHFGDLFLDFQELRAWGINAMVVVKAVFSKHEISLSVKKLAGKENILVKGIDIGDDSVYLIINDSKYGPYSRRDFIHGIIIEHINS